MVKLPLENIEEMAAWARANAIKPTTIRGRSYYLLFQEDYAKAIRIQQAKPESNLREICRRQYIRRIGPLFDILKHVKPKTIARFARGMTTGLEVGAGCGQYADVLNRWGYRVTALEPNPRLIQGFRGRTVYAFGESIPFGDKAFDFSYVINVLHHADDPIAVLQEMKRVSGRVIIAEINANNPLARAFIRLRLPFDRVGKHFSPGLFRWMVETALGEVEMCSQSLLGIPEVFMWAVKG